MILPKKRIHLFTAIFLIGLVGYNLIVWNHAKSMAYFSSSGVASKKPEELTFSEKLSALIFGINIPKPVNKLTPENVGLQYHSFKLDSESNHELVAWYVPANNSKKIVLLFHGYANSKDEMLSLAREVNTLGYDAFLIDFYGSGESTGNSTTIGVNESHDVKSAFDFVKY